MYWEVTLLNRLYKTSEFCRVKARMQNDKVVFVVNAGEKLQTVLFKVQKEDAWVSEREVLEHFGIETVETGQLLAYQREVKDLEYYQHMELHFVYQALKLTVSRGKRRIPQALGFIR